MKKLLLILLAGMLLLCGCTSDPTSTQTPDPSVTPGGSVGGKYADEYVTLRGEDGTTYSLKVANTRGQRLYVIKLKDEGQSIEAVEDMIYLPSYLERVCNEEAIKQVPPYEADKQPTYCLYLTPLEANEIISAHYSIYSITHCCCYAYDKNSDCLIPQTSHEHSEWHSWG